MTGIIPLLVVILGGGFVSAVLALLKARPDRDNTVVATAEQATAILDDLNHTLVTELDKHRELLKACIIERRKLEEQLERWSS